MCLPVGILEILILVAFGFPNGCSRQRDKSACPCLPRVLPPPPGAYAFYSILPTTSTAVVCSTAAVYSLFCSICACGVHAIGTVFPLQYAALTRTRAFVRESSPVLRTAKGNRSCPPSDTIIAEGGCYRLSVEAKKCMAEVGAHVQSAHGWPSAFLSFLRRSPSVEDGTIRQQPILSSRL